MLSPSLPDLDDVPFDLQVGNFDSICKVGTAFVKQGLLYVNSSWFEKSVVSFTAREAVTCRSLLGRLRLLVNSTDFVTGSAK
eukprot:Awhi_evm1s10844